MNLKPLQYAGISAGIALVAFLLAVFGVVPGLVGVIGSVSGAGWTACFLISIVSMFFESKGVERPRWLDPLVCVCCGAVAALALSSILYGITIISIATVAGKIAVGTGLAKLLPYILPFGIPVGLIVAYKKGWIDTQKLWIVSLVLIFVAAFSSGPVRDLITAMIALYWIWGAHQRRLW